MATAKTTTTQKRKAPEDVLPDALTTAAAGDPTDGGEVAEVEAPVTYGTLLVGDTEFPIFRKPGPLRVSRVFSSDAAAIQHVYGFFEFCLGAEAMDKFMGLVDELEEENGATGEFTSELLRSLMEGITGRPTQ